MPFCYPALEDEVVRVGVDWNSQSAKLKVAPNPIGAGHATCDFNPHLNNTQTALQADMAGQESADSKRKAARETIDILQEISSLLNTQLDRHTLSYCVSLIENGVNPKALASVIQELRAQNERYEIERGREAAGK